MGTLILSHLYKVTISIWDNQNSKPGLTDSKAYIQKVHFYFIVKIVLKRPPQKYTENSKDKRETKKEN